MSLQPNDSNLLQTGRNLIAGNHSAEYTLIDILMEPCRTQLENYFTNIVEKTDAGANSFELRYFLLEYSA